MKLAIPPVSATAVARLFSIAKRVFIRERYSFIIATGNKDFLNKRTNELV